MKGAIATCLCLGFMALGILTLFSPSVSEALTQTYGNCAGTPSTCALTGYGITVTTGVIGVLAPDPTHYSNALIPIVLPLAVAMFGAVGVDTIVKNPQGDSTRKGDLMVHGILGGFWVGALISDLTTQTAPPTGGGFVPFGMIVLATIIWALWWWNS